MWSVGQEVVSPVDEKWRHVEKVQFLDHVMALGGVKGRTKINKKDSGKIVRR